MNKTAEEILLIEKCYNWYVFFQWGIAAPDHYFDGLQYGFEGGIPWLIEQGYIKLTEKGEKFKPIRKKP